MSAATTTITREVPPKSGLRAFVDRWKGGDEIAHLITLTASAGIILITSLLVLELWRTSHLSRAKFGWMFFWHEGLGCELRQFRRGDVHLRNAGNFRSRAGDRRTVGIGQRHFSFGAGAAAAERHRFVSDRFVGGGAQRHLRTAGNIYRGSADAHHVGSGFETQFWDSRRCLPAPITAWDF